MAVSLPHAFDRRRLPPLTWGLVVELACRAGFVARGFVYVSVGLIALLAALGRTPEPKGAQGALAEAWADWPPGVVLLWLAGMGLYGFAGWRVLQSIFDADQQGASAKALLSRAGQAISGLVYFGLAVSVFGLLDALEDLHEPDDQAATREAVAKVMDLPAGPWLVLAAGVFVMAAGLGNIAQAVFRRFQRGMDCDADVGRAAAVLGRLGYLARGVAFLPAGALLVTAGAHARASEAGGMGAALEVFQDLPFGDLMLGLVALGLIAFGLFAFAEARFRRLGAQRVVDS